ncbi:MAG: tRNA lysidine(34) synthetase TilS, partial [Eubacteriales bacterium]|nr:tRNA lysidine(34) synthetase TilS [Eubacteriales bacterium]
MNNLYLRVKKYILDREMIRPGEAVVAGVSGGADSLCLFEVLRKLAEELPFSLYVVHVHHGLRDSAQGDLLFVEEICRQAGVPCVTVHRDAACAASAWGTGVEEAGRRIRYEAFDRACRSIEEEKGTACRIAVAHHREDQAETVLFHLCRGTDLRGARGMLPVSGRIIRPLLPESRGAIEAFLREKGLSWREDETNGDISYTRNYLRAEILPRLAEGVNPAAAERIAQFAGVCADAERYLSRMTEEGLRRCAVAEGAGPGTAATAETAVMAVPGGAAPRGLAGGG